MMARWGSARWLVVVVLPQRRALGLVSSCIGRRRVAVRASDVLEVGASMVEVVRPRRVGPAEHSSPVCGPYVGDSDVVLETASVSIEADKVTEASVEGDRRTMRAFARAGPRASVRLISGRCAVVTCGGLCPGLNAVVQEVVRGLAQYGVSEVLGVRGGYQGLVNGDFFVLDDVEGWYAMGGTALTTSRGKRDPAAMAKVLEEHEVEALFVVGGDGTMRGARAICAALGDESPVKVVAVPKTIDNDIPLIDKSFGFDTAVAKAKEAIATAVVEARAFPRGVGVVRLMGRDAGFLAAHAALASPGDVDAVLVPEKGFALDPLLDYLGRRLDERDSAVLVVAEGVNARLSDTGPLKDVGPWLCDKIRDKFDDASLKYVDPSYMVRAEPPNPSDVILCSRLATNAVHAALAGFTDCAVAMLSGHFAIVPLDHLAHKAEILAVHGHLWADVARSTGQPDFTVEDDQDCDVDAAESPYGGCVVTYDDHSPQK